MFVYVHFDIGTNTIQVEVDYLNFYLILYKPGKVSGTKFSQSCFYYILRIPILVNFPGTNICNIS